MRNALRELRVSELQPDHVGLAYDRWAPLDEASGKIADDSRSIWLQQLAETRVSPDYVDALERWRSSLGERDSVLVELRLTSRLLIGHGNPSPTDVGLTVHHTWGVPMIPGTAIKGLLSQYVDIVFGPQNRGAHPRSPEADQERAPFQGVTWSGSRIAHGPGEVYRALFGAPAAESDETFETTESRGGVVFHDALFVPEGKKDAPFAVDVLTVHQKTYYNQNGLQLPNDYDDPNPVTFLTVQPGTKFLFALSGAQDWIELALQLLMEALSEWGVGGKTSSGYGRFEAGRLPKRHTEELEDPELRAFITDKNLTQRDRVVALREVKVPALGSISVSQASAFKKLVRDEFKSPKLKGLVQALLEEIDALVSY